MAGFLDLRVVAAACALMALAACTAVVPGGVTPPPGNTTSGYINQDLSTAVIAFDVPVVLEPLEGASRLSYDVIVPGLGERHILSVLDFADTDVSDSLPPPAEGRTYYLFAPGDKDKAALREAQAFAGATRPTVSVGPRFCAAGPVDPQKLVISVLLILPGKAAEPLVSKQTLASALAASGTELPACAGHSG
jgi:hypothetical protein